MQWIKSTFNQLKENIFNIKHVNKGYLKHIIKKKQKFQLLISMLSFGANSKSFFHIQW